MPVEFLSDDDAASYGRFTRAPDQKELERAFFLDDADKDLVARRRGDHNRLGFALQLTTVRWLGTFLPDPLDLPEEVVAYLASQLGVAATSCANRYMDRVGQLADEDLLPKWGGRVLRDLAKGQVDVVLSTRQLDSDGKTTLGHAHERRQTFSAVRLSGVCEVCNNGWMSRIENEAKPFVEPMIRDIRTGVPCRSLVVVARWLALKTLVGDLVDHSHHTATGDDYHAFFADPNPPDGFEAFLGRVDLRGAQESYFYLQPHLAAQARDGLGVNEPLSLQFDLSMGPFWAQALYVRLGARQYPRGEARQTSPWWARVWPQSREVNWPPPKSFTVDMLPEGINQFPEAAEWIKQNVRRP